MDPKQNNADYIPDEELIPWLNNAYLVKVLSSHENQTIQIINFTKEPATEKCENYASLIHLVKVNYILTNSKEQRKISLIVKSESTDETVSEITEHFNVFQRESQVYEKLLKTFENMLNEIGLKSTLGPRYIYLEKGVIILENLKERGYAICDVKNGLSYNHCSKVLEKIAQFHACSMVLFNKNPSLFQYHMQPNLTENEETPLHSFFINMFQSTIDVCEMVSGLELFVPKLKSYNKDIISRICKVYSRSSNGINVLNHGDAWCNNFMFKFKEDSAETIDDVLLVDYQEGFFGSPGIDLNCFIFSSWSPETFVNHKDDLIKIYHNFLEDILTKLNYNNKIPTINDIYDELELKRDHGLVTATCLLPVYLNEHPDLADPINFISDTKDAQEIRLKIINNPKYIALLEIFLKDFFR